MFYVLQKPESKWGKVLLIRIRKQLEKEHISNNLVFLQKIFRKFIIIPFCQKYHYILFGCFNTMLSNDSVGMHIACYSLLHDL